MYTHKMVPRIEQTMSTFHTVMHMGRRARLNTHQATLRALVSFNFLSNNNKKDFFWLMCFIFVYNTPAIQLLIKSTDKYENNNEYSKVSQ